MNNKFTIVVSSSDAYEDCWNPFFYLLNRYWPNCAVPIVLNSDTKVFQHPQLNIICPTVGKIAGRNYKWGESFLKTLDFVDTEIILLFMIDYFVRSPIQVDAINDLVDLMYRDDLTHIQLSSNVPAPNHKCSYPMLLERDHHAPYRFCLQAGLWKKNRLNLYIRKYENPWLGETWGTKRAWRLKDSFYCLSQEFEQAHGKIIDYHHLGGMRQGKWRKEEVVDLFRQHDIEMDFSIRGFYDDSKIISFSERLKKKLDRVPSEVRSWLELQLIMRT